MTEYQEALQTIDRMVYLSVCILTSFCSVMLMYGSAKNSRWLILPWLVATFLFILAYIAGMILSTHLFGVSLLSIAFLAIAIIEVTSSET